MGLLDKISCFSIWETVTGCMSCWLLQKIYSGNVFFSLTADLQGAQLSVTDQSKRWQQSPQKTPKPECQTTFSDVDRSINKRQKMPQKVAGSWRSALWAHIWQRVHLRNKGIWGENRSCSCCCCTCMSSTRQNTSINKREIFLNWFPEPETENSDAIQTFEETFQYRSMVNWLEFCINLNLLYFCMCLTFFFHLKSSYLKLLRHYCFRPINI